MSVEQTLWVEKYRPKSLDDIIGQQDTVRRLRQYVDDEEMPHLLFSGKQGVGKTACIVAFAREKYGANWRNNVLEMNASDERKIEHVREKIKNRAVEGTVDADHQFQIIFLDEADYLTDDAQAVLRRVMEDYADVTRFVLSCNYPNQIIGPIQSRCAPFRITPLSDSEIREVLVRVIDGEALDVEEEAVERIVAYSHGDARTAINTLQACTVDGTLTEDDISAVVGVVDDILIKEIVDIAVGGELDDAFARFDDEILKEGVSVQVLTDSFLRVVKRMDIAPDVKVKIIDKLADCDWRVRQGANQNVQYHSLLADIHVAHHLSYPNSKKKQPMEPYREEES